MIIVDFTGFSSPIKLEMKYLYRLKEKIVRLSTIVVYSRFNEFLSQYYPKVNSFAEIDFNKARVQFRSFLISIGVNVDVNGRIAAIFYENLLNQIDLFYKDFYDTRDEFEKDTWDFRKLPVANYSASRSHYYIHFYDIPFQFRSMVKQYMKMRISKCSDAQCSRDVKTIKLFLNFVINIHPSWNDLGSLKRKDMEDYFSWLHSYTGGNLNKELEYLMFIKIFLEYIQRAQYTQAPVLPVMLLVFKEDIPRIPMRTENDIKYIPENVLLQLDQNIEYINPPDCIPIVILLRAPGWRISDILNLRYDNCLDKTSQGWYLCGDIQKTQVLNHRVPITDEVAAIVKSVIEVTKPRSTSNNNPNRLLFVRLTGKRIGQPPESRRVSRCFKYPG